MPEPEPEPDCWNDFWAREAVSARWVNFVVCVKAVGEFKAGGRSRPSAGVRASRMLGARDLGFLREGLVPRFV